MSLQKYFAQEETIIYAIVMHRLCLTSVLFLCIQHIQFGICEKSCVDDPPQLKNAIVKSTSKSNGAILIYVCHQNFYKAEYGTVKCVEGKWRGKLPVCRERLGLSQIRKQQIYFQPKIWGNEIWRKRSCKGGPFICTADLLEIESCKSRAPPVKYALSDTKSYTNREILNYTCFPGFRKVEDGTIRCINGRWHGRIPVCIQESCIYDPPQVKNAILESTSKSNGAILTYVCHQDFYKAEYGTVKCVEGKWRGKLPVCRESRCVIDATKFPGIIPPQYGTYLNDKAITPQCKNGYKSSSEGNGVMRCFNGEWKGAIPPCVPDSCIDPPPPLDNGIIEKFLGLHETGVTYTCNEYFILKNSSEPITCQFGQWKGKVPECKSTKCEVKAFENGEFEAAATRTTYKRFRLSNETIYRSVRLPFKSRSGTSMHVRCKRPYTFNGNSSAERVLIECKEGRWDPHPLCLKQLIECPELERTKGLTITYQNGKQVNSKAIFHCDVGYRMTGAASIICQRNGSWSDSPAYCTLTFCRADLLYDTLPESMILDFPLLPTEPQLPIGTSFAIKCRDDNYELVHNHVVTCTQTGQWSVGNVNCRLRNTTPNPEIECPELEQTEDLIVIYTNGRQINSRAMFYCNVGYKLSGAASAICQPNGAWSDSAPYCTRQQHSTTTSSPDVSGCKFITKEDETIPIIITDRKEIYKFGEHVMFVCPRGKRLVPDIERVICLGSGWSDDFPECHSIPR